jgi:hypothetical protein
MTSRSVAVVVASLAMLVASGAFAQKLSIGPAPTQSNTQISAGIRYGSDNLGLGFGGRAGYTLPFGLYLGGVFDYFLGTHQSQSVPGGGVSVSADASMWDAGGEVGYDLGLLPVLVLRPYLGFGNAHASVSQCISAGQGANCTNQSADKAFIQFGGLLEYVAGGFFAGGDLRIMVVDDSAFILGGHAGLLF